MGFQDTLSLSGWQYAVLVLNFCLWLWCSRKPRSVLPVFFLSQYLLFSVFTTPLFLDVKLAFLSRTEILHAPMSRILQHLPYLNYLKYQPPLYAWFLASFGGNFRYFQIVNLALTGLIAGLLHKRIGHELTCFVLATPLFQLMSTQPTNDWIALTCLLCLRECSSKLGKGFWFVTACCWKYTSIVLFPFLCLDMSYGSVALLTLCGIGWWTRGGLWWTIQSRYLLHSFSMGLISMYRTLPSHRYNVPLPLWYQLIVMIRVRWRYVGSGMAAQLPCAWCPAYALLSPRRLFLLFGLLFGYGNLKYAILLVVL